MSLRLNVISLHVYNHCHLGMNDITSVFTCQQFNTTHRTFYIFDIAAVKKYRNAIVLATATGNAHDFFIFVLYVFHICANTFSWDRQDFSHTTLHHPTILSLFPFAAIIVQCSLIPNSMNFMFLISRPSLSASISLN